MSYELRIHKLQVTRHEEQISDKSSGHVARTR